MKRKKPLTNLFGEVVSATKKIHRVKGSQLGPAPTLVIPWPEHKIRWDSEKFCEKINCPFCGFHTDEYEIDSHLSECEEAVKLKKLLGGNMKLNANVLKQGTLTTHTFLRVKHLQGGKTEATIVAFREAEANMPYSDYLLDVKIGKNTFTQGLRERNEDFIRLCKKYGLDTDKWIGKTVVLYKEKYLSQAGKASDIVKVSPK